MRKYVEVRLGQPSRLRLMSYHVPRPARWRPAGVEAWAGWMWGHRVIWALFGWTCSVRAAVESFCKLVSR